jgi:hypothetical protein
MTTELGHRQTGESARGNLIEERLLVAILDRAEPKRGSDGIEHQCVILRRIAVLLRFDPALARIVHERHDRRALESAVRGRQLVRTAVPGFLPLRRIDPGVEEFASDCCDRSKRCLAAHGRDAAIEHISSAAVAAPHADLRQPIEDGSHRRRCVLFAILFGEGIARGRVLREVMIELRDLTERRGAGPAIVDDRGDQLRGVVRLEPVVLAVQHHHRSAHACPRPGPVLLLRLLMEGERPAVVAGIARTDDALPHFAELRIARRDCRRRLAFQQISREIGGARVDLARELLWIGAAELQGVALEPQHALEPRCRAAAPDHHARNFLISGHQRCVVRAHARAENDDAPGIDVWPRLQLTQSGAVMR